MAGSFVASMMNNVLTILKIKVEELETTSKEKNKNEDELYWSKLNNNGKYRCVISMLNIVFHTGLGWKMSIGYKEEQEHITLQLFDTL